MYNSCKDSIDNPELSSELPENVPVLYACCISNICLKKQQLKNKMEIKTLFD